MTALERALTVKLPWVRGGCWDVCNQLCPCDLHAAIARVIEEAERDMAAILL